MKNSLYIQLFSPHGLIRFNKPQVGYDPDTGGQVKYLIELLKVLSQHPKVKKVDLFTRLIKDKRVSPDYSEKIEVVNEKTRIVRLPCGGYTYRKKEQLWSYLDEYIDNVIKFIAEEEGTPDIVHGHYADGMYIANEVSDIFKIPLVLTGHSLGLVKKQSLLASGLSEDIIQKEFKMGERVEAEKRALKRAELLIVSTQSEIENQCSLYEESNHVAKKVLPPGVNTQVFYPHYRYQLTPNELTIEKENIIYHIRNEISRFLDNPELPLILSIGRADKRKNFDTIIEAYGNDKQLQKMANLAIFAGIRKDIMQMSEEEKQTLTNLLLLMDKFDLYGKLAIPKKSNPTEEIPEIYRIAASQGGVFVNATERENFGLTILEAGASGLPIVAGYLGGTKETLTKCQNGIAIDVTSSEKIAETIKQILSNKEEWQSFSDRGIQNIHSLYSWKKHVEEYVNVLLDLKRKHDAIQKQKDTHKVVNVGKRFMGCNYAFISDIDGTILGDGNTHNIQKIKKWLRINKEKLLFGLATGRNRSLTLQAVEENKLPFPDVIICSAGSEIYYTKEMQYDRGWESYISTNWNREKINQVLKGFSKIQIQEEEAQGSYKISYYTKDNFNQDDLSMIYKILADNQIKVSILLTDNTFLDILPVRANKGTAVKYLSNKWKIPLVNIITSGNGGNDKEMLLAVKKAIVVGNYSTELEQLKKNKHIYFAKNSFSLGILEGLQYFNFLQKK